jgi:TRAP-type C4-dicarboxylate transport system substrate-binding protein
MGLVIAAQFVAVDPVFSIFDLPGLLHDYDQVSAALAGPFGALLTAHLTKLGVHPVYWPQQGFSAIATTRKDLTTPADFKRLKLRAHSRELARMFQLLGAAPTVIAPSEVTTAISRGTIDGLSTSIASYYTRKWFENAPHLNDSGFGAISVAIIINQAAWDGLPADLQTVLASAATEAETASTQATIAEERETLGALAARGVKITHFDATATASFLRLTKPMYDEYAANAGADGKALLDMLHAHK